MRFGLRLFLIALGGCAPRELITIKGSDTVLPVSQALAETYLELHPAPLISVTGGGSGVGIAALLNGDTDIAMSSRPLKLAERLRLTAAGRTLLEDTIAWDVLAVCVHPSNPLSHLTREALVAIYTGAVTNWKELGGPDLPIVVYSRESSSGTFEFFGSMYYGERTLPPRCGLSRPQARSSSPSPRRQALLATWALPI